MPPALSSHGRPRLTEAPDCPRLPCFGCVTKPRSVESPSASALGLELFHSASASVSRSCKLPSATSSCSRPPADIPSHNGRVNTAPGSPWSSSASSWLGTECQTQPDRSHARDLGSVPTSWLRPAPARPRTPLVVPSSCSSEALVAASQTPTPPPCYIAWPQRAHAGETVASGHPSPPKLPSASGGRRPPQLCSQPSSFPRLFHTASAPTSAASHSNRVEGLSALASASVSRSCLLPSALGPSPNSHLRCMFPSAATSLARPRTSTAQPQTACSPRTSPVGLGLLPLGLGLPSRPRTSPSVSDQVPVFSRPCRLDRLQALLRPPPNLAPDREQLPALF